MGHLIDTTESFANSILVFEAALPVEVELGSPRNPNCLNYGICRLHLMHGRAFNLLPSCCPGRAQGHIRQWEQRGVELIFPKENMAPAMLEKHFGTGWFKVEDAYEMPSDVAESLGIAGFTFEPGKYPLLEMDGRFHVVFG